MRNIHSRLFNFVSLACLFVTSLVPTALAESYLIEFNFDLVPTDNTDAIAEPPGDLIISVAVDSGNDKATTNPLTAQLLRDAAAPSLAAIADILKAQIAATNASLQKLVGTAPSASDLSSLPDEVKAQILLLNSVYAALCEQAQLEANFAISRKWTALQAENNALKQWKTNTRIGIGKNFFGVVWGTAKIAIECAVNVPAAGVGTVFMVYDAAKTLEAAYDLYKGLRTEFISLESAQQDLLRSVAAAGGGPAAAAKPPGKKFAFSDSLAATFKAESLRGKIELVRMKMLATRAKATALAGLLNDACLKEDALKGQADLAAAAAAFAKNRSDWLKEIDGMNAKIENAKACVDQGELLLATWKPAELAKARAAWDGFRNALDLAMTVWGWVNFDPSATASIPVAVVDTVSSAPEYLGKLKTAARTLRAKMAAARK